MELRYLRYFVVVAKELNLSRAAMRLHISQSHLTRIVAQLEAELGVKLLWRTTRQMLLTQAGEALLQEAQEILCKSERLVEVVQAAARQQAGRISVAMTEMALHSLVPTVLSAFRNRYPQVEINTIEACTEEQVELLHTSKVDIGFLHPPLRTNLLSWQNLYQEEFAIALSTHHRYAQRSQIKLQDLAEETFILHSRTDGPVLYDEILGLCKESGFSPKIIHPGNDQTFIGLITAGVGVCFMPPSLGKAISTIVCVPIDGEKLGLEYAIAWRKDSLHTLVRAFLEIALTEGENFSS
jgi:DNA-binding transcriptional LysR family regulator